MASGTFRHTVAECNHAINGRYIHHHPERIIDDRETVKTYENDCTRTLLVPSRKPTEPPIILPTTEVQRLRKQAVIVTKEERLKRLEQAKANEIRLQDESQRRKKQMQDAQLEQRAKAGSKLSAIEAEAARKSQYLLERAFELRQEQEDEVKRANSLILATKCLAIRRAQLIEKALMSKELEEEERRLDDMMEQRRQQAIRDEEEKHRVVAARNKRHTEEMAQQIRENEILRLVEQEKKEEESRNINRALIQMQREEVEKQRQKRLKQERVQAGLMKANEELDQFKIVQREEQRMIEMRVQQFMREKAAREDAIEREYREQKAAKEKETARLRAMQEKANDAQAAKDEMNAKRVQEQVEKEWRDKERAAALKKKQIIESVKTGRDKQLEDIRRAQALEIERDEVEFHRVAKVQLSEQEKDLAKRRKRRQAAECHRRELLKQINDKEMERIKSNQEWFEEGNAIRLEQEVRSLKLKEVLKKKMVRLKEEKLPDKYIGDIKRQLHLN